jgi:hypothetical protein
VKPARLSSARRGILILATAFALSACGTATSTPVPTAPPSTTGSISAPTASPTAKPTLAPTAGATLTSAPTATAASTPTAAASPTSPAAVCTGTADNKAFFVDAAKDLPFDVYCAVLPASWWLHSGSYRAQPDPYLTWPVLGVTYRTSGGAISIGEGHYCEVSCWPSIPMPPPVATIAFGDRTGTLYWEAPYWELFLPVYAMNGWGMTKAEFIAWAAALVKVPKT